MNSSAALYTERLLAHAREPRRLGLPEQPCVIGEASNRLCGDAVRLGIRIGSHHVEAFGFEAEACAMTVAAASMLGDAALSQPLLNITNLAEAFRHWLNGDDGEAPADIIRRTGFDAFVELKKLPSRRRCALLPFEALSAALRQIDTNDADHDRA